MNNWYPSAHAILISHGFTPGHSVNTRLWYARGSQEIRLNEGGFSYLSTHGGVFIQNFYARGLQLLENVIFFQGLNKEFAVRLFPKYGSIEIFKNKVKSL